MIGRIAYDWGGCPMAACAAKRCPLPAAQKASPSGLLLSFFLERCLVLAPSSAASRSAPSAAPSLLWCFFFYSQASSSILSTVYLTWPGETSMVAPHLTACIACPQG